MFRFYADEQLPPLITYKLRRLGHEVIQVRELSSNKRGDGWSDTVVLEEASLHEAAVLTRNTKDFRALHRETKGNHYGIVVCVFVDSTDMKKVAKSIDTEVRQHTSLRGKLLRVTCT